MRPIRDPRPLAIADVDKAAVTIARVPYTVRSVLQASTKRARLDIEHGEASASRRIVLEDERSADEGRLEQARPFPGHRDLAAVGMLDDGALRA